MEVWKKPKKACKGWCLQELDNNLRGTPAVVSWWSWGTWTVMDSSTVMDLALAQHRSLAALSLPSSRVTHQPFPWEEGLALQHLCTWWASVNWGASIPSLLPLPLKELYLASSKILVIPTDVFSELSELEKLDLSHNQITEKDIKKAAFGNMIKLENLNLAENLLTWVRHNLRSSLKDLKAWQKEKDLMRQEAFLNVENLGLISEIKVYSI